ncbi:MAG: NAD(P)-binding protein [Bacteroidota bacterium]
MQKTKEIAAKYDAIIVGSGLGGLLCGYILSKEGLNVCIIEKQPHPGGNLLTFTKHGNKFETGVHYIGALGAGQTLNRYWNYFGLMSKLKFKQLDVNGFDIIGFGDTEFPLAQGFSNFRERLLPFFPDAAKEITGYIEQLQQVASSFALYNLELPTARQGHPFSNISASAFFQDVAAGKSHPDSGTSLSSALAGNNFLYGGSNLSPLNMAALIAHSFISGAYRIVGGSEQIVAILANEIISMGGSIVTSRKVSAIEPLNNEFRIIAGNNEIFYSRIVISNIHPATTISMMPENSWRPAFRKRITGLKNTVAPFILFISLKPGTFPYLNHNYYFHSTNNPWISESNNEALLPSMYLLSTACHRMEQKFAETLTILTYMDFNEVKKWEQTSVGKRGREYLDFKNMRAEKLLNLVSQKFPSLRSSIAFIEISTPLTYRDYTGTPDGSLYGIQKSYAEPEATLVTPKTKIPNFYFTGQNINLHGVLGVTVGAVMTCGEILGYEYLLKKIKDV